MARKSQDLRDMMEALRRFSGPGESYFWHKNVTGTTLNPHQLLYFEDFETRARVVVKGSRRVRKSFPVAAHFLKEAAIKPHTEVNIFAPALEQSKRNIQYMTDMIYRSPLLMNFLDKRTGGLAIGREFIRFRNGSVIQAKGQASSVDGLGSTHIWLEEYDDMDLEVVNTRIVPTGSMLKDGYDYGAVKQCQIIVTGTIKGMQNLYKLEFPDPDTPERFRYKMAEVFDCWYGVAAGIISEDFIEAARQMMTEEQFARTYLALYTESSNFFPTRFLAKMMTPHLNGVEFNLRLPERTGRYAPFGQVLVGMDFAGQGQQEGRSSRYAIVFVDMVAPTLYAVIHAEEFDPLTPPLEIRERIKELLKFYRPVRGIGDAYDSTLIFDICQDAYAMGLHRMDPKKYKHGEGKEGWESWWMIPVIYSGPRRHSMYMYAQRAVYDRGLVHPPVKALHPDFDRMTDPIQKMIDQMEGIVSTPTQGGYDKYEPSNKILGDDLVDALVGALECRHFVKKQYRPFGGSAGQTGDGFQMPTFATPTFAPQMFKGQSDD